MILKRIRMKNIRSYEEEEINFNETSILLLGDIGSGKSTVLLAIEFALFGIQKDEVAPETLLRHGSPEGFVELTFKIDEDEYIIRRTLKRGSGGISQKAGYLIKNGEKIDAMPTELKTRIIQLLGYPQELVSKSKSSIFRYTVYTPQEQMKHIIMTDSEERLQILRKLFGIDKYKQIRENLDFYVRELKQKTRFLEGETKDLEEFKAEHETRLVLLKKTINDSEGLAKEIDEKNKTLTQKKQELKALEESIRYLTQQKKDYSVLQTKLLAIQRQFQIFSREKNQLTQEVESLKKEFENLKVISAEKVLQKLEEIKQKKDEAQKTFVETNSKIREHETEKRLINQNKAELNSLKNSCPTCKQAVSNDYKEGINIVENKRISVLDEHINALKVSLEKSLSEQKRLNEEFDKYNKYFQEAKLQQLKQRYLDEKVKKLADISKNAGELTSEMDKTATQIKLTEGEIEKNKHIEQGYTNKRLELEVFEKSFNEQKMLYATLKERADSVKKSLDELTERIAKKELKQKELAKHKLMINWLEGYFEKMMVSMEKHVMGVAYHEFNALVSSWFETLVGDDFLELRLDDTFSPRLIQNGYETGVDNLSGGEKTAVALAYRLALNKVINDITTHIQTKDLIILDEPTDGFSAEQLERMRDVLAQLGTKQTIIVSHELRMQDYAQQIIRITKQEHTSKAS